jgi:hypothetical protein
MRFFLDTEFIEDGKTIELLSIGIVADDGREYYAEVAGADYSRADNWVQANVIEHLKGGHFLKTREKIADEIVEFVGKNPCFWAYFADYDWVALCQLYGRMLDLPESWPMYCKDLKQWADYLVVPRAAFPKMTGTEHHALQDARWNKDVFDFLDAEDKRGWRT